MTYKEARDLLVQYNKWRRDDHVPNSYVMPNPTEIGKAIDAAIIALITLEKGAKRMKWHKYPEEKPNNNSCILAFKFTADAHPKIDCAQVLHYIDKEPHWMDAHGYVCDDKDIDRWIYVEDIVIETKDYD